MATLSERIKQARASARVNQTAMATAVGVSRGAATQWESGETEPTPENLRKIAEFLEVSFEWLATERGPMKIAAGSVEGRPASKPTAPAGETPAVLADVPYPSRQSMPLDVPVRGAVQGGRTGDFTFNGDTIDVVRRPPGLRYAKNVYALYVTSDSMSPRYEQGDLIYVNPDRPPAIGDDVVIEFHGVDGEPGEGFIKRLVKRTTVIVTCQQFNPPEVVEYEAALVKALHRVVPWREAMGA